MENTIQCANGRVGEIVEDRGHCVFARPLDAPQHVGYLGGVLNTLTCWDRQPNGSLHGMWFDSPYNAFVDANFLQSEG